MGYESVNPYNGETVKTFDELTDAQLERKITGASAAYQSWKQKSYAERAVIVAKAAELMRTNVDCFACLATLEMGKLINDHLPPLPSLSGMETSLATTLRSLSNSTASVAV